MKRRGNLYAKICDHDNIRAAILSASIGKRSRPDVRHVLENIEHYTKNLSQLLEAEKFTPSELTVATIREGSRQKTRTIHKPQFWPDQCVHWAIYLVISPSMYNGFYALSCGSIPGKGVHYGKRFIEKWLRTDRKNTKYYLQMDVRHFYPSVDIDELLKLLRRKFKDEKLLNLLQLVLQGNEGLPIGVLLSQLFANFYLTPLDYHIKQKLKAVYYERYMDDMVIFGANKKKLHKMREEIAAFIDPYGLSLKPNWQVRKTDKEPLDFMGFRFYRDKTTLRKSLMYSITRRNRRVNKKGKNATAREAAGVISQLGWVKHSDSYYLFKNRIAPYLHIQRLKNIIRKEAMKRENSKKHSKAHRMGQHQQPHHCLP